MNITDTGDALVYIATDKTPKLTLGRNVAKVVVHRSGDVDVVSKESFTPAYLVYSGDGYQQPITPKQRPFKVTSTPNGHITGTSKTTGKDFRINTATEYVAAAQRQGIPIEFPGLFSRITRKLAELRKS